MIDGSRMENGGNDENSGNGENGMISEISMRPSHFDHYTFKVVEKVADKVVENWVFGGIEKGVKR